MEFLFYRFVYPAGVMLGKLFRSRRDSIERWLVKENNKWVKKYFSGNRQLIAAKEKQVLLLLPHCLQWSECVHRIVGNILNCAECGKCDIKDIVDLGKKYGIIMKVATGGRLAKRLVTKINPDVILAVACERELVEGLFAIWPRRAAVIVLDRPNGPCIDTRVEVAAVEEWLKVVGGGKQ